jgi:hypothetical protein
MPFSGKWTARVGIRTEHIRKALLALDPIRLLSQAT